MLKILRTLAIGYLVLENQHNKPTSHLDELDEKIVDIASTDLFDAPNPDLVEKLEGKKISVVTSVIGGKGDSICAAKFARILIDLFKVSRDQVYLGLNPPSHCIKGELLGVDCGGWGSSRLEGADLVIAGPAIDFDPRMFASNSPTLAIHEYGAIKRNYIGANVHPYYLGLSPDSIGIILNKDLMAWSSSKKTKIQQLEKLKNIPIQLQIEILGARYSLNAIEAFARTSKLYFGYAHDTFQMISFIEAVASMNHQLDSSSDLCFYFMGNEPPHFSDTEEKKLSALGIQSIEISEGNRRKNLEISETGKRLKVIVFPISPKHVNALHMASEYETLATGDQSFSEAISARKIPAYEVYFHKTKFFQQFQKLLPDDLKNESLDFYEETGSLPIRYSFNVKKLANFYLQIKTNSTLSDYVIKVIHTQYNFEDKFRSILEQAI